MANTIRGHLYNLKIIPSCWSALHILCLNNTVQCYNSYIWHLEQESSHHVLVSVSTPWLNVCSPILNTITGSDPISRPSISRRLVINPVIGSHYIPLCPQLLSLPKSVTTFCPVSNYTVWWYRQMCVNNLPSVVTWKWHGQESNLRCLDRESNTVTITPPSHTLSNIFTIFKSSNIYLINDSRYYFNFEPPSELLIKRKDKFIEKFMASQSLLDYFAIQ